MNKNDQIDLSAGMICPVPMSEYERILLAHGGGGTLSHQLLQKMIFPQFDNELLRTEHDGAIWEVNGMRFAFSTDSYVVRPIFFPGGNIGELAVYGTVNDLSMCGARPLYLSAGFIIEEGFLMEDFWKIVQAMKKAAEKAGVKIVTGDTKVVDRGKGDKIYVNTSGVGLVYEGVNISPQRIQSGHKIIVNGKIAEHGLAILSAREEFEFQTSIESDSAPLNELIAEILRVCPEIPMLRDPTRGGISSALNEIAMKAQKGIRLEERQIPIAEEIKALCEVLGFDPLYVANEGKVLVFVPPSKVSKVLQVMHRHPYGKEAVVIGEVVDDHPGRVVMKTLIGSNRVVDMLSGEQLPRIC